MPAALLTACGDDGGEAAPPALSAICKETPRKAPTAVRGARPVEGGTGLRALYWGSRSARPCFFRARPVPRGNELRLFVRAPRPPSKRRRAWCAEVPLPERLRGQVLVLIHEHGARPPGAGGRRTLRAGTGCVRVPVVRWREGGNGRG